MNYDTDKMREYMRRYRQEHPEYLKEENRKYAERHPNFWKKYNPRKLLFRNKRINLKFEPRKGTCLDCKRTVESGEIKRTQIHHIQYHDDDPLKDTVELCTACHRRRHRKFTTSS